MHGIEELLAHRQEIDAELRKHKSPVTVMFTDMAGSTKFFERFGDTAGMAWIEEHYRIVFPHVQNRGGVVVKTIGDSVMAYFTDPKQAVEAAVAIENDIERNNGARAGSEQMHVRVALHHGLAYLKGADVFGDVVNVAARIAKNCLPGQILVSEALYVSAKDLVTSTFRLAGTAQFHGKTGTEKLFEILWTDEDTYARLRELFPPKKDQAQSTFQEELSGGRYIIMNELGRGAMGVVYKAYDRSIGRMVAFKTIPLEVDEHDKPELLARLKQEARAAGGLDHPNIVTVYDVGEEAGMFYFTMQYVEGKTLAALRAERTLLPLHQVLDIIDQVCSAIGFAHQAGIIHRDLKPSNLMLTASGQIKVMDFGIAKLGDAGLTKAGVIIGTPSYLAPEQAAGRRIDYRADIFALGSVLYELLTAEKAFAGETTTSIIFKILNEEPIPPRAIEPSLPPALDDIVRKALAKDPNVRFQSCEEMREALRNCKNNPKVASGVAKTSIRRTVSAPTPPPPPKRHPGRIVAAVLLVILGLGATGGFLGWRKIMQPLPAVPPVRAELPKPPVDAAPAPADTPTAEPTPAEPAPPPAPEDAKPAEPASEQAAEATAKEVQPELAAKSKKEKAKAGRAANKRSGDRPAANAFRAGDLLGTREDVPVLLSKADGYYGNGNYKTAAWMYEEILKIDPANAAAKEGLRRAREAQNVRR